MQTKTIAKRIAMENGLDDVFVDFISKRFKGEIDEKYIREWANRFKTGNPMLFMDSKSAAVYTALMV